MTNALSVMVFVPRAGKMNLCHSFPFPPNMFNASVLSSIDWLRYFYTSISMRSSRWPTWGSCPTQSEPYLLQQCYSISRPINVNGYVICVKMESCSAMALVLVQVHDFNKQSKVLFTEIIFKIRAVLIGMENLCLGSEHFRLQVEAQMIECSWILKRPYAEKIKCLRDRL